MGLNDSRILFPSAPETCSIRLVGTTAAPTQREENTMADEKRPKKADGDEKDKDAEGKDKETTEQKAKEATDAVAAEEPEFEIEKEAAEALATIGANPQRPIVTIADINRITLGELVLSYPARDVTLMLDGATAARVLAAYARPERRGRLQDYLNIETSTMRNQWSSFDLENLLAVSWYPGLPSKAAGRMTVDPPGPDADAESPAVTRAAS